jgi:hypothetical protein
LGDEVVNKIPFFNGYTLPPGATVLVRAGKNYELPVVAGLQVGKGRLFLVGTNLDPADEPLDKVLFDYIYRENRLRFELPAATPQPAAPAPAVSIFTDAPPAAGGKNVLLFVSNTKLEVPMFKAVGGGQVHVVTLPEAAGFFANPNPFAGVDVMAWGPNRLGDTPPALLNDPVAEKIRQFVDHGGDFIIFEQSRDDNWDIVEKSFGVHKHKGGPYPYVSMSPALAAAMTAVGLDADMLGQVGFYQGYDLPENAEVLARGGKLNEAPTVAIVPHGRGRVILCGASLGNKDLLFSEGLLSFIYHLKAAPAPR